MPDDPRSTPAMQQYYRFKRQHPECVLLFRMGDFYEMFDRDAEEVSRAIGLTLTQRTAGVPMAGVPYHQLDGYVRRLLAKGYRVAIAEQMEDASAAKGLVKRAVTRVLTPGTLVEDAHLSPDAAGMLAAVLFTEAGDEAPASLAIVDASTGFFVLTDSPGRELGDEAPASLAIVDASTGFFVLTDSPGRELGDELVRRGVRELLYAQTADGKAPDRVQRVLAALGVAGTPRPAWQFRHQEALEAVRTHFGVSTLAGFGLRDDDPALGAAGALLAYLLQTQAPATEDASPGPARPLGHLRPPRREDRSGGLIIDAVSLRALEVERTIRGPAGVGAAPASPAGDGSLLGLFHAAGVGAGRCRTSMGRRLLRDWLVRPLADVASIEQRQSGVAVLVDDRTLAGALATPLEGIQDVARIAGRLALGRASPRDLVGLGRSLDLLSATARAIEGVAALSRLHAALLEASTHLAPLARSILEACVDDPPATLGKAGKEAGLFRDGVDAALDEARLLQRDAGSWLVAYQQRLVAEHNLPIASGAVKVGFNQVFGYYIELSTAQARSAPASFIRKQTLKNAERYTTPELREFEAKAMNAEARASERERALFDELCRRAASLSGPIASAGAAAAELDALLALADRAVARGWTRPAVVPEPALEITSGRHPVLEVSLGANFVPNDLSLGAAAGAEQAQALALITGPNMAGKSTFIRQTALIVLLAHAGSFVPAERAVIGLTDRIFTRVGADDALFAGQSTFMVEMTETANILHHATAGSLVILDEIGRGTSTLDGLALAWAIAESLAGTPERPGPRTLFATHYHEITRLADDPAFAPRVRNLHVVVREWPPGDEHAQIVFLHRIMPGRADQSYGVHVARLAGIPPEVVSRARVILASLSVGKEGDPAVATAPAPDGAPRRKGARKPQMPLFEPAEPHPALAQLREIKLETMSPMQAWDEIRRLKQLTDGQT